MDSSESSLEKTASLISIGEEQFISFSNFNEPILYKFLRFDNEESSLKLQIERMPVTVDRFDISSRLVRETFPVVENKSPWI